MMELERLYAMGEDLGMAGAQFKRWVDAEIASERGQRAQNREDPKEQAEQDRLRLGAEERMLNLKLQTVLAVLPRGSTRRTGITEGAQSLTRAATDVFSAHKLIPPFNEERDDLDAFLKRFERLVSDREALMFIGRLDCNAATDYDQLKPTLLQRFRYTAEEPEDNETTMQYAGSISGSIDHLIEMRKIDKCFDSLRDAIISLPRIKYMRDPLYDVEMGTLKEPGHLMNRPLCGPQTELGAIRVPLPCGRHLPRN
ncbi:hypothetical protein HPB52_007651 [Rhipicephalus sanguineus]|uniref:Uncharacterized protein n=1 Tax=Rhipicephalus sanguineus TaxID=34632 RepID=A0A9D4PEY8_RHISA|nr:hypothetical protein HPB52_007651 [Rhipicephalus sanguineus]